MRSSTSVEHAVLPAGGGEPGKGFQANLAAMQKGDVNAMLATVVKEQADKMRAQQKDPEFGSMVELMKAFAPKSAKVTGGQDFGDIFEQIFGARGPGGRAGGARVRPAPEPQRGSDVEHPVTLTFEQAARGTTLPLQINRDGRLETIDVKIPAGVKDGSRVRIRGKGEQTGGTPGDLFIITTIQPHQYYRREGLDILLDLPVSLY